eukprot:750636-Hanusia_phi.AAC.3
MKNSASFSEDADSTTPDAFGLLGQMTCSNVITETREEFQKTVDVRSEKVFTTDARRCTTPRESTGMANVLTNKQQRYRT